MLVQDSQCIAVVGFEIEVIEKIQRLVSTPLPQNHAMFSVIMRIMEVVINIQSGLGNIS